MDLPNVDEPRGKCIGNPDYDPAVDLDGDGCITELDLSPINTPVIHPIDVSPPSQLE
jgi:hypothetical protein